MLLGGVGVAPPWCRGRSAGAREQQTDIAVKSWNDVVTTELPSCINSYQRNEKFIYRENQKEKEKSETSRRAFKRAAERFNEPLNFIQSTNPRHDYGKKLNNRCNVTLRPQVEVADTENPFAARLTPKSDGFGAMIASFTWVS